MWSYEILKGNRQAWARINSTLGESNKKSIAWNRILKYAIFGLIPLVVILPYVFYNAGYDQGTGIAPCSNINNSQFVKSMPLEGRNTYGVAVDVDRHLAYVLNRDKTISILSTCKDDVQTPMKLSAKALVVNLHETVRNNFDFVDFFTGKLGIDDLLLFKIRLSKFLNGTMYETKLYLLNDAANIVSVKINEDPDDKGTPIIDLGNDKNHSLIAMQFDKTNQMLYVLDRISATIYVVNTENDTPLSNIKLSLPFINNSLAKPNDMVLDPANHILYVKYDALNNITAINVAESNQSQQQVNIKLVYKIPNDKAIPKNVDSFIPGAMSVDQYGVLYFTVGENKNIRVKNVYSSQNGI